MDITRPLPLLGGLSPETFMRRHWHKRPLLVRQALPGVAPPLPRRELFALAARDDVESRLVEQRGEAWHVRQGPLPRRALPPLSRDGWTLLVQGLDLHNDTAHELLSRFRFVPDARLDDLMLSYATHGGGVGPHFDSYDVFLIQVQGARRWRVGRGGRAAGRPAQARIRAGRVDQRAEADGVVRARSSLARRRGCAPGSAHPHALRRAARLHQWRGLHRLRPRRDADAQAGRRTP